MCWHFHIKRHSSESRWVRPFWARNRSSSYKLSRPWFADSRCPTWFYHIRRLFYRADSRGIGIKFLVEEPGYAAAFYADIFIFCKLYLLRPTVSCDHAEMTYCYTQIGILADKLGERACLAVAVRHLPYKKKRAAAERGCKRTWKNDNRTGERKVKK